MSNYRGVVTKDGQEWRLTEAFDTREEALKAAQQVVQNMPPTTAPVEAYVRFVGFDQPTSSIILGYKQCDHDWSDYSKGPGTFCLRCDMKL